MKKGKNTRKKFWLSISLLVVSIVAITGAVVGVYAASVQNWQSEFNIGYDVEDNIAAEIKAYYAMAGEASSNIGEVRFNTNDTENSRSLGVQHRIELSREQLHVDFTYTFKNLSKTNAIQVSSSWSSFSSDISNINCTYHITTTSVGSETQVTSASGFSQMAFQLPANAEYSITMRFAVKDILASAYVSSDVQNGLSFTLTHI